MPRWRTGFVCLLLVSSLEAKPRIPLSDTAFDSGVLSAETLGRGGTVASNRDTAASGSENPAALAGADKRSALYTTVLVNTSSPLPSDRVRAANPLSGKVLQYLSIKAEKGVFYFEPMSRQERRGITTPSDFSDIEFSMNALGIAGGDTFKKTGGFGLSFAYLWGSMAETRYVGGFFNQNLSDTGNGVRMNLGFRYPMGPTMWGMVVQNAPGFVWWKDYRRTLLPIRFRVGNTWRVQPGVLLSVDGERRFYNEGGDPEDFIYIGNETHFLGRVAFRAGVFSDNIGRPRSRRWTGGITFKDPAGAELSYAIEFFTIGDEKVNRSFVSLNWPFVTADSNE